MRFFLVHLLLIFPACAIAYLIAPYVNFQQVRITYRHDVASNEIRAVRLWAMNQLSANPQIQFAEYDSDDLWREMGNNRDPWNNKYHIVELNRRGLFDSSSTFHVYSLGSDGKSNSGGNDPDDINSWDYDRSKHYGRMIVAQSNRENLWRAFWITPLTFGILLFVVHTFKKSHRIAR